MTHNKIDHAVFSTDQMLVPDQDQPGGLSRLAAGARAVARTGVSASRRGISAIVARGPATMRAARSGARGTVEALQTLPDTSLRSLGATSVGLGVGLSFTRARRLAFLAGIVPALIEAAIVARRTERPTPTDAGA